MKGFPNAFFEGFGSHLSNLCDLQIFTESVFTIKYPTNYTLEGKEVKLCFHVFNVENSPEDKDIFITDSLNNSTFNSSQKGSLLYPKTDNTTLLAANNSFST